MADIREMLAQLLGQQQQEPNLNPGAPINQPGTRGMFGRRPTGRPATGYADIAPVAPQWAQVQPYRDIQPPGEPAMPMGPGAFMRPPPGEILPAPMPRAARMQVSDQMSPGSFGNFGDYANAQLSLRAPALPVDREPWRSPTNTERMSVGDTARVGGFAPPSAPPGRQQASLEDDAWNAAVRRARASAGQEGPDPTGLRREADRELGRVRNGAYVGNYSRW